MQKLGIVGGGISGLTCAYKLQDKYEISLFEKEQGLGGQAQSFVINGIPVESAVSVLGKPTYPEFYKLMEEIGYDGLHPYRISGLHAHYPDKTELYVDTNPRRILKLFPKYLKDKPAGLLRTAQLVPFILQLYKDHKNGKLDGAMVMDAYDIYPQYETQITTVLTALSLITAVDIKNTSISHVLNFVFDFENNTGSMNPARQVLNMFMTIDVPENGTSTYISRLRERTNANFQPGKAIKKVKLNKDGTVSITTRSNKTHKFDKVIIATQPNSIASFLECRNEEETSRFERLSKMVTRTLVTNHTDEEILEGALPADGLIDYRLDSYKNTSQTTITRNRHFYTAQTLPDGFENHGTYLDEFIDTRITPDNYSINRNKILSQHVHAVPNMTPETRKLHGQILGQSGQDNLHFACAALSNYPTSQEGGVRSALRVVKEL